MTTRGIRAALEPYLEARRGRSAADAELLDEELLRFLSHRGLPVDEEAGQLVIAAPADAFDPALAWAFVADHLASRVSLPVVRLARAARMLGRALEDAAGHGALPMEQALAVVETLRAATSELPRLDALARALKAEVVRGRPDHALWVKDRAAYSAAMEAWESSRRVDQEVEGGFTVTTIEPDQLVLSQPAASTLSLRLPPSTLALARRGDRIDALLGRAGDRFLVLDAFAAAAPTRS